MTVLPANTTDEYQSSGSVSLFDFEDFTPYVRYASEGGSKREAVLRPVDSPIGEGVNTVGPVYLLSDGQIGRLEDLAANPYGIKGTSNIAKELQDECESAGRVLYPLYAESDDLNDGHDPTEVVETVKQFVQTLGFDATACRWFHSGGRSIQAHLPAYTTGEYLPRAKETAEGFNHGREITVDPQVFSRKRQFRIPGTTHERTGLPKVGIDAGSDEPLPSTKRQVEVYRSGEAKPDTFAGYWESSPKVEWQPDDVSISYQNTQTLNGARVSGTDAVPTRNIGSVPTGENTLKNPYLKDTEGYISYLSGRKQQDDPYPSEVRKRYERHEYSPYGKATGGVRSVVVFRVKGEPFRRDENGPWYVPAYVLGGIGCDPSYAVWYQDCPVLLSKRDYEKRQWSDSDLVALIGGRSHDSRIYDLTHTQADILAGTLSTGYRKPDFDPAERKAKALEVLSNDSDLFGFEVGSVGASTEYGPSVATTEHTDTAELQRRIENGTVEAEYNDAFRVACRLLRTHGWREAVQWFAEVYGEDFDATDTHRRLKRIVQWKPDAYRVEVPKTPYDPTRVTETDI
jgi:hypothetical protein